MSKNKTIEIEAAGVLEMNLGLFFSISEHIDTDELFDLFSQYEAKPEPVFMLQKYGIIIGLRKAKFTTVQEKIIALLTVWYDNKFNILELKAKKAIPLFFYIDKELTAAADWEEKNLNFKPDADMISAGFHDFDRFGFFNTIDSLVKKFNVQAVYNNDAKLIRTPWDVVCDWQYAIVRMKLHKDLIEYNYNKELEEIRYRKASK